MNIETGEIGPLAEMLKKFGSKKIVPLKREPRKGCKYCCGRGYEYTNVKGEKVPCRCTVGNGKKSRR